MSSVKFKAYDLRKTYKLIPERKFYCVALYAGCNIDFRTKKESEDFLLKLSNFFNEVLSVVDVINNSIFPYKSFLSHKDKTKNSTTSIFYENENVIFETSKNLIFPSYDNVRPDYFIFKLQIMLKSLHKNVKILNLETNSKLNHVLAFVDKITKSFHYCINNAYTLYKTNSLTIFKI